MTKPKQSCDLMPNLTNPKNRPTTEIHMFKNNIIGVLPKYFTSKEATFILRNEDSRSWWFDFQDPLYGFLVIDYLPLNSPSLEVNFGHINKVEGYNRVKEMTEDEGWEFLHGEDGFNAWLMEEKGCVCDKRCIIDGHNPCLCKCHNKDRR